ncbi:MAG TPA: 50S ribosomal protein P1 [Candidatus Thermoplasmatota archaeon]|nr:50S ribosomal protein P1 [Candidatus Thermoplasmatota archaeon]
MEYVYAAMLLHSAGKKVSEDAVTKVLKAADVSVEATRVKALAAALEGVNIDEAIATAIAAPAAAAQPAHAAGPAKTEDKKKEEKKEPEVSEDEAAAGLGALFG